VVVVRTPEIDAFTLWPGLSITANDGYCYNILRQELPARRQKKLFNCTDQLHQVFTCVDGLGENYWYWLLTVPGGTTLGTILSAEEKTSCQVRSLLRWGDRIRKPQWHSAY